MLLHTLKIISAVGTILTGLFALIKPQSIRGFTGLNPESGRGFTEVRAIFGGLFIVLGSLPLVLNYDLAYGMLGAAYLGIGLVRAVSMLVDRSANSSNIISLIVEVVFGLILVVPK